MRLFLIFLITLVFCSSCSEEKKIVDPGEFFFDSLTIDKDTIVPGETATMNATARGFELKYHWSVSAGHILGSGNQVLYAPAPCSIGKNTITCRVGDGNGNSLSKSVNIVVE